MVKSVGSNMIEVTRGPLTFLVSYSTPVSYHETGMGYSRTRKYWSVTTSKHINKWLRGNPAKEVEQADIDRLFEGV